MQEQCAATMHATMLNFDSANPARYSQVPIPRMEGHAIPLWSSLSVNSLQIVLFPSHLAKYFVDESRPELQAPCRPDHLRQLCRNQFDRGFELVSFSLNLAIYVTDCICSLDTIKMPPRIQATSSLALSKPSPHTHCTSCLQRAFSSTPHSQSATRLRRRMFAWLNGPGASMRQPIPNSTNYLGAAGRKAPTRRTRQRKHDGDAESPDSRALEEAAVDTPSKAKENDKSLRPFPLNPHFVSQSVLSDALRYEVWKRVQVDKKPVRQVSVELGIEMRRVGAVVRLVEVEKRMKAEVRSSPFSLHAPVRRSA